MFCVLTSGKESIEVATHVLQFVFLGNNGFPFPFAHFPTKEADPASLYTNFWEAVGWLKRFGFTANYCCCDGGEANRSFVKTSREKTQKMKGLQPQILLPESLWFFF
jgi:hypothetical protein